MSKSRAVILTSILGLTLFSSSCFAVTLNGKDWRQLTETTSFSWDQLATVCPSGGGACSGSLGAVSFDGWTWATATEIGDLFHAYSSFAGGLSSFSQGGNIFSTTDLGLLSFTQDGSTVDLVSGWSATSTATGAYYATISYNLAINSFSMSTNNLTAKWLAAGSIGAWLYRDSPLAPVPLPAALPLLAAGLSAMGFMGWRKRRKASAA